MVIDSPIFSILPRILDIVFLAVSICSAQQYFHFEENTISIIKNNSGLNKGIEDDRRRRKGVGDL
ncbi:hypothetical protein TUM4438_00550 [Shewanella sairae]|uniref:Uncharacterized protein n=1 Tax=Shewanella sairae TaxID=190310 RepID=A0ABQ4NYR2_9GAMM|nr:hypothetical protein TUM4438_00550 [Shewanella sairae]